MESSRTNERLVALVSGANKGLGREIARRLAEEGMTVILGSRDLEKGEVAAEDLSRESGEAFAIQLAVTDEKSVERARDYVENEHGRLDVLVNNAGTLYDTWQNASNADLGQAHEALETNLFGAWRLCEAFVPLMRENGYGRIVNVSSSDGSISGAGAGVPAYRVSKAALNMLTKTLAAELRDTGILVNCCNPGWLRTDMGGSGAPLSVEEGADTPVWLATLPSEGQTGGFFSSRREMAW